VLLIKWKEQGVGIRHSDLDSGRPSFRAKDVMIASGHYLATTAGYQILRAGGNAIDAGVAAGICLNVVMPDLTSFGGVAPTIVYSRKQNEVRSFSGLGPWGEGASVEHFEKHHDGVIPIGAPRSVVPGAADAWLSSLAQYGSLSFREVVTPAIELCENGLVVYDSLARSFSRHEETIRQWPSSAAVMLPGDRPLTTGEVFFQHELANTFKRMIAAEEAASSQGRVAGIEAARDEFYIGDIGKQIVEFISAQGGFLSESDIRNFRSEVEVPLSVDYRGYDVYACNAWCQGPAMLETLNILAKFDVPQMQHNSAEYIHVLYQALDLAFADREAYFGDPHFVNVPVEEMLSEAYTQAQIARMGDRNPFQEIPAPGETSVTPVGHAASPVGNSRSPEQPDTSYVCVVDAEGNAFSATPSDAASSTPMIPGLGLICSSRGSQSRVDANHPSSVEAGKRPRLTPSPAMVFQNGELFMPYGTPGADMQVQAMVQALVNIVDFGMHPQQAIEQPRVRTYNHPESFAPHTYRPGLRRAEPGVEPDVVEELISLGHNVEMWPSWTRSCGNVCAIVVDQEHKTLTGGADPRAESYVIGW
jgi:gamma-glutamyltranspeptidase / glutathione hydrolase